MTDGIRYVEWKCEQGDNFFVILNKTNLDSNVSHFSRSRWRILGQQDPWVQTWEVYIWRVLGQHDPWWQTGEDGSLRMRRKVVYYYQLYCMWKNFFKTRVRLQNTGQEVIESTKQLDVGQGWPSGPSIHNHEDQDMSDLKYSKRPWMKLCWSWRLLWEECQYFRFSLFSKFFPTINNTKISSNVKLLKKRILSKNRKFNIMDCMWEGTLGENNNYRTQENMLSNGKIQKLPKVKHRFWDCMIAE